MNKWQSRRIDAYRVATWPYRMMKLAQRCRAGTVPIFTLFYHRVADDDLNPWTIRCADFERQIEWFRERFEIVDLQECQRRIQSGFNARPTLSITFDDGYADNCDFALPMLIEKRIPVTYFVTNHHTLDQQPFEHDVALGKPLATNTLESLRALDMAGVEIAAHTRTHADLGKIQDEETLVDEVLTASQELESAIGREVRYFAFPFGQYPNLNSRVFSMLRDAGFLGVCSAYGGWNDVGLDGFHLQRIHGDPNFSRIKNWLTYDPRLALVQRYDESDSSVSTPASSRRREPLPSPGIGLPTADLTSQILSPQSTEPSC